MWKKNLNQNDRGNHDINLFAKQETLCIQNNFNKVKMSQLKQSSFPLYVFYIEKIYCSDKLYF